MIRFICSTMMLPLTLTILVVFGVVASQSHDVNSKIPYGRRPTQGSVESTTLIPPDPTVKDDGMRLLLTRLETLCVEKLEYLITDTNNRFQSLEKQSLKAQRLLVEKLDNLTTEVGQLSKCCSVPATPAIQNNEILEEKVENLSKDIRSLMEATKNLTLDMEAMKKNVSSLINVTRLSEGLSSNSKLQQISNEELPEIKDLQPAPSTSCPLDTTLDKKYPRNCREVAECEKTASGNYMIQPEHAPNPFEVVCELETRGGGWTVIQRRFDGSQDFYLGWEDYKKGFGNLEGEFWLGLENIHILTGFEVNNELLIELGDFYSRNGSAFYSNFNVGSEIEGYPLKAVGDYSGDAGDDFTDSVGMKFSTKDNDQDDSSIFHCAQRWEGAWWYTDCLLCNLNGKYAGSDQPYVDAIYWFSFEGHTNLKQTRMLVRPKV